MTSVLLLTAGFLSGMAYTYFKKQNDPNFVSQKEAKDLNRLFNHYWNGQNDDELYAWYRVRNHVMNWKPYPTQGMLAYIQSRISILDSRTIKSDIFVEANGKFTGSEVDLYNSNLL